jgi:peroxiredoxin
VAVTVQSRLRVTAAEGVRAAVLADVGLTIASEWMFSPELQSGAVRAVLSEWSLPALDAAKPEFDKYGASLVAISPQTAPNSRKSVRQNKLSFPILSDAKGKVGPAFGLRFGLPDYLVELYKQLKNDLPTFNDDSGWTLPMPARYVIGPEGVILYSEVNPYTRRPEPYPI